MAGIDHAPQCWLLLQREGTLRLSRGGTTGEADGEDEDEET